MPTLNGVEYAMNENSVSVLTADESYQVSDISLNYNFVIDWTLKGLGGENFTRVLFIKDYLALFEANET
tara:strand:+ start:1112 stop:1318 length:207 start_codon:yes stop_codon:yes gene_type:complete